MLTSVAAIQFVRAIVAVVVPVAALVHGPALSVRAAKPVGRQASVTCSSQPRGAVNITKNTNKKQTKKNKNEINCNKYNKGKNKEPYSKKQQT